MYKAIEKTYSRRTSLRGNKTETKYWAVENAETGALYANITAEEAFACGHLPKDFAETLAFALNNGLPVSANGGLTDYQYTEAKAAMNA